MASSTQYQSKSMRDLGMEALWFLAHTVLAILSLGAILYAGILLRIGDEPIEPKLAGTALAFLFPMGVGFGIARWKRNDIGRYVWISGILLFATVCVWVLDLPTGAGLCEHCGAVDKLWRTFFDVSHGSGLMGGDGLMVGVWIPLALFGYAMGAGLGIEDKQEE